VADDVFDWAQEQEQEQLQDFPPLIEFAFSVLISVTRFSLSIIFTSSIYRNYIFFSKLLINFHSSSNKENPANQNGDKENTRQSMPCAKAES